MDANRIERIHYNDDKETFHLVTTVDGKEVFILVDDLDIANLLSAWRKYRVGEYLPNFDLSALNRKTN